jgi:hypothetical protein
MSITLEQYLNKNKQVQAARKKLQAANSELADAQKGASGLSRPGVPASATAQVNTRIQAAQQKVAEAKQQVTEVEASTTKYYETNVNRITAKADQQKVAKAKQKLEEATAERQRLAGLLDQRQLAALDNRILDLNDQVNLTGKYAPKETIPQPNTDPSTATRGEDLQSLIDGAPAYLYSRNKKQILQLSKDLKAAGYEVPQVNVLNPALLSAYVRSLEETRGYNDLYNTNLSWGDYLVVKDRETAAIKAARGEGKPAPGTVSISTPSEAAGIINQIYQSNLGRLPTPAELKAETDALIKEEKKFSSVTRPVKRVGPGGVEYLEYVGGIDRNQFLAERIRKKPEYNERKAAANALTRDELAKTARANGLNLDKDFGDSVNNWVKRVENGEDIDIFKGLIRGTAKLGMPQNVQKLIDDGLDLESVYAPYKRVMASNLELTPDSINLNDPLLRTAIGPDKEMSIYDFEKSIRQDNRWQYTNKAREEVADATLRVLRDFGLMG